jgi:hypothetical protein
MVASSLSLGASAQTPLDPAARAGGSGNTFSASPWAADGKVYLLMRINSK